MELIVLIGIGIGLGIDAFSVAIATSMTLKTLSPAQAMRLSFSFGIFQFFMPIIGWLAGASIEERVAAYDHWIALALLGSLGGKMIWDSFPREREQMKVDPTNGLALLVLSVATSIDALAVGFSLALLEVPVFFPAVVIGLTAGALTLIGTIVGRHAGALLGVWVQRAGGIILLAIGLKIVLEHTLS